MKPYYENDGITIYHGDCVEAMGEMGLQADQFDMIFTSPPYNLGISTGGGFGGYRQVRKKGIGRVSSKWDGGALAHGYGAHSDDMALDEYEDWQRICLGEMWNLLGPAGAIFYNHKPRVQAGEVWLPTVLNPGLPLRQIVTWARAGGVNFNPTHFLPTYEWILIFAKDQWRLKSKAASGATDVWRVPQESGTEHPAPFPIGLPARAIEAAAPKSVLDPFMGSGSTLRAAMNAGVRAVGIDSYEPYCEMSAKRLEQGVFAFSEFVSPANE